LPISINEGSGSAALPRQERSALIASIDCVFWLSTFRIVLSDITRHQNRYSHLSYLRIILLLAKEIKFIKEYRLINITMSKINIEVSDPVVLALRKHVVDKNGSMRGMGKVVEEALRDYLMKNNVPIV